MPDNPFCFDERAAGPGPAWCHRLLSWLRDRRLALLVAAGVFQAAVLAAMVAIHAAPLVLGETILLRVEPLDPRDLFRGDYVILAYGISRVPPQGIEGIPSSRQPQGGSNYNYPPREPEEQTVYVSLEPDADGTHWRGTRFSIQRPATGKYICGVYRREYYGPGRLCYGIETFYVSEGSGPKYEQAARTRQLTAEIALTSRGQAKLRGLRIEN